MRAKNKRMVQQIDETVLLMKILLRSDPNRSNQIIPTTKSEVEKERNTDKMTPIIFEGLFSTRPLKKISSLTNVSFFNSILNSFSNSVLKEITKTVRQKFRVKDNIVWIIFLKEWFFDDIIFIPVSTDCQSPKTIWDLFIDCCKGRSPSDKYKAQNRPFSGSPNLKSLEYLISLNLT